MSLCLSLHDIVDRVVLINLRRRPDRLVNVQNELAKIEWPFQPLEVVAAVDAHLVQHPKNWATGGGSFGCCRSHLRELERALNDGIKTIMVLEDDFYFTKPATFVEDVQKFFSEVPQDWEFVALGAQHHATPQTISENVVKFTNIQRTHCYIVRGQRITDLYHHWLSSKNHIDWDFKNFIPKWKAYGPKEWLIGQDESKSDISGSNDAKRSWNSPPKEMPVIWLRNTPRETVEALRERGFHGGRRRDNDGQDIGLPEVWRQPLPKLKVASLQKWVGMIQGEAYSMPEGAVATLWHQDAEANEQIVRDACGSSLIELNNPTVEEAMKAWQERK